MDSAELLDILGNENRRRILRLLSRRPCYVTEISEYLGVSPKAVIDHLRKLEDAGLVESRTDDQRRKYFSISRNLRLEVSVSPYEFGMKSAYPASTSLDVSRWRYLSLDVQFDTDGEDRKDDEAQDDRASEAVDGDPASNDDRTVERATDLAAELDELQRLQRELSLAQRWVHGRIADVQNRLGDALNGEEENRLHAEILSAIAGGATTVGEIGRAVEAPEHVVKGCLSELADAGFVTCEESGEWVLAE